MSKIFISYSHDSKKHSERVLALANRLRKDGLDCILDQYEISPEEGWPKWMARQLGEAGQVIIICTSTYRNRVMGEEKPGKGKGVKWESTLAYQYIYDEDSKNKRFIPVVFEEDDRKYIPEILRGATIYCVNNEEGYDKLYWRLTNQPEIEKPEIGQIKKRPPRKVEEDFLVTSLSNGINVSNYETPTIGDQLFSRETELDPPAKSRKAIRVSRENERYIWQEADNSCAFCRERDIATHNKHHIEFVSRGGGNETDNLILVCSNCHNKIHAGIISEYEIKDRKVWLRLRQQKPGGYNLLDKSFFENEGQRGEARILHLRAATWNFILKGDYIDRDQQFGLLSLAEQQKAFPGDSFLIIRGKPGSGKSALMRWIAYQLHLKGNTVLQMTDLHDEWREQLRKFSERRGKSHFYVIADDIFRGDVILDALRTGEARENQIIFTLIGTTRTNEDRSSKLEGLGYGTSPEKAPFYLNPPSEDEKLRILKKLEQDETHKHEISTLSDEEKQRLLDAPSMLVLMLQLSEGKLFQRIIEDVVMRLPDGEGCPACQVFGVLCSFYQFGVAVPQEILKFCLPTVEKSYIDTLINRAMHEKGKLAGLIGKKQVLGYEGLTTLHEIIAVKAIDLGLNSTESNYPYSSNDLETYLSLFIHKLDEQNETHKRWIIYAFWALVMNNEAELVKRLLGTFSQQIKRLCEASSITSKFRWQRLYETLQQADSQKCVIEQILLSDPENGNVTDWSLWIKVFEQFGTVEQKRNFRTRIERWLQERSDFTVPFLSLIEGYGTEEQIKKTIFKTHMWLDSHPRDSYVRTKYLALVERYGTKDEKRQTIEETRKWLEKHSEDHYVRTKYISFCGKAYAEKVEIEIKVILNEQWKWIKEQSIVYSDMWFTFLRNISDFLLEKSDLVQNAVKLALIQHPDNLFLIGNTFKFFRDYLEKELCYRLAEKIISFKLPPSNYLRYWVYAANFFRDEGEYDKAKSVYQGLFRFCQNKVGDVYRDTFNFASVSYAQLLLLQRKPDEALFYLESPLKQEPKNPFTNLIKAQYFKAKGQYNEATDCFKKAVQYVRYKNEYFWYEYGFFVRKYLKNNEKAKRHFETSIKHKENLSAYVGLAEIQLEYRNKEEAKILLEKGLNVKPIKPKERERLGSRIQAIQRAL